MMDPIKEKLLKLLRLTTQGIGGERSAAEAALHKLLAKHGLTMKDLEDADAAPVKFVMDYKNKNEEMLSIQVCFQVCGSCTFKVYGLRGKRNQHLIAEVTAAQKAEILVRYDIYRRALKQEIDVFCKAFIQRNEIFSSAPSERADRKLSAAELAEQHRVLKMAQTISKTNVLKQIGDR